MLGTYLMRKRGGVREGQKNEMNRKKEGKRKEGGEEEERKRRKREVRYANSQSILITIPYSAQNLKCPVFFFPGFTLEILIYCHTERPTRAEANLPRKHN